MTSARWLLASLLLAGCVRHVNVDETSAAGHLREAKRERAAASAHAAAGTTKWQTGRALEHSLHASEHEVAAADLMALEDLECRDVAKRERASCPFFGPISKVEPIADGIRLTLVPDAPTFALVEQIRCHLAHARAKGIFLPSCPLMLRGVIATALPDGHTIELHSDHREVVHELQKRSKEIGAELAH